MPVSGGSGAAVVYKENTGVYRGLCALYSLYVETGNEILLHPGYATKESWDLATTQKVCWEKPISLLAMQQNVRWKGQLVNGALWVFTEVKRGSTVSTLADCRWWRLLCFSQTLITLWECGFSFLKALHLHEYLAGKSLVWKQHFWQSFYFHQNCFSTLGAG